MRKQQSARGVTPIEGRKVQAIGATVAQQHHERPNGGAAESRTPRAGEPDVPEVAVFAAGHRTTDLAYQVDAESKRVSVQVVDRATGSVVRSFPMSMPGQAASTDGKTAAAASAGGGEDAPRGALIDAKV